VGALHERLSAIAAAAVRKPWQLEGSLRGNAAGWRAGRVMLESVDFSVVAAVAEVLAIAVPERVAELAALAVAEGVPLIAGWDTGDAAPRAKLYLNASDAAPAVRTRLLHATGVTTAPIPDPHVIGIDLRQHTEPELKLYRQDPDATRLAARVASSASSLSDGSARLAAGAGVEGSSPAERGGSARLAAGAASGSMQRGGQAVLLVRGAHAAVQLARAALAEDACAGAVVSWSVSAKAATPRAFFVATRAGAETAIERLVSSLPGWNGARVPELLGFAPGAARSIGVSLQDGATFTVYFKPRGVAPVARLEAAAQFRSGAVEVGLFIEPSELVERAFARSDRHALSYRAREGQPVPREIEALMHWACERMMAAERAGSSPDAALLDQPPPAPWRLVRR
jgi:hypothetical protein